MEFDEVSEKVKSTKIKFTVFSIALFVADIFAFISFDNMGIWGLFVLLTFVIWIISAIIYIVIQRKNEQKNQENFINTFETHVFLLDLSKKSVQHKKKVFLTFMGSIGFAWILYLLPISGFSSFIIAAIALVWLLFNIVYISFPTHLQLNHNILSGKKDGRYLWSVDITKQMLYEAYDVNGELLRIFYIREPKRSRKLSFLPCELPKQSEFFELLAKILERDPKIFYQSTYGIAIALHELSIESIEKVKPVSLKKDSVAKLLLDSLWALVSIFSSKYDSTGSRYVGTRITKWIFAMSIGFGLGAVPTLLEYKPVYITSYPAINNIFVDSGVLMSHHVYKGYDYLKLAKPDGTQIHLYNMSKYSSWQKETMADAFVVKVWWFPLNSGNKGYIHKIEMKGVEALSPTEQKKNYQDDIDFYLKVLWEMYLLFGVAFFAWMWEFVVRYKRNERIRLLE